jgi:hypothetical protein
MPSPATGGWEGYKKGGGGRGSVMRVLSRVATRQRVVPHSLERGHKAALSRDKVSLWSPETGNCKGYQETVNSVELGGFQSRS